MTGKVVKLTRGGQPVFWCCGCGTSDGELRPYGPNRALICWPCFVRQEQDTIWEMMLLEELLGALRGDSTGRLSSAWRT